MMPDILIFDADKMICAVEIGYTRPEKLTAYREIYKIPDVRWYDKSGQLHTAFERPVVKAHLKFCPSGEFRVYVTTNDISCSECYNDELEGGEDDEAAFSNSFVDVLSTIITDLIKVFIVCECDKCGRIWLAEEDEAYDIISELRDLDSLSWRVLGKIIKRDSWEGIQHYFDKLEHGVPDYAEGIWIDPNSKFEARRLKIEPARLGDD